MRAIALQVVVAAIVASTAHGQVVVAQGEPVSPPLRSSALCDPHGPQQLYVDCALWLDMGQLRRGSDGDVIDREHVTRPMQLTLQVKGDSAQRYAARYEQLAWIAAPFRFLSIVGLGTAAVLDLHGCKPAGCSNDSRHRTARIWATSGLTAFVISIPFNGAAHRDAARAIWWNNASLKTTTSLR